MCESLVFSFPSFCSFTKWEQLVVSMALFNSLRAHTHPLSTLQPPHLSCTVQLCGILLLNDFWGMHKWRAKQSLCIGFVLECGQYSLDFSEFQNIASMFSLSCGTNPFVRPSFLLDSHKYFLISFPLLVGLISLSLSFPDSWSWVQLSSSIWIPPWWQNIDCIVVVKQKLWWCNTFNRRSWHVQFSVFAFVNMGVCTCHLYVCVCMGKWVTLFLSAIFS